MRRNSKDSDTVGYPGISAQANQETCIKNFFDLVQLAQVALSHSMLQKPRIDDVRTSA